MVVLGRRKTVSHSGVGNHVSSSGGVRSQGEGCDEGDSNGMGGTGHSTLPTSIHAPKVTKSVSQKYTLFGTVGGSITLLSATIMIAIYNSRKRKNREMVQQQRSRIRQSFVELYLTNRFTTSDMIRFN